MSVELISDALKNSSAKGLDRFVLVCLANFADEHGVAWPSVKKVSDRCGISESSVHRCIKSLLVIGEVEIIEAGGMVNQIKKPNRYQLRIPKEPKKSDSKELQSTGVNLTPVPQGHGCQRDTGVSLARVSDRQGTGVSVTPVRVSGGHPIRHLDPSIKLQEKKTPPSPKREDDVPIPLLLQTPRFIQAWQDLKADRKERRKPMTRRSQEMSLEKCLSLGHDAAIEAIKHSIASGYQGVYPESQNGRNAPLPPKRIKTEPGY